MLHLYESVCIEKVFIHFGTHILIVPQKYGSTVKYVQMTKENHLNYLWQIN